MTNAMQLLTSNRLLSIRGRCASVSFTACHFTASRHVFRTVQVFATFHGVQRFVSSCTLEAVERSCEWFESGICNGVIKPEEEQDQSVPSSDAREFCDKAVSISFHCPDCSTVCSSITAIRQHVARVHTAQFTCDVCSKSFGRKADLDRHQIVHENAKMYRCSLCGSSFNRLDNAILHLRRTHKQSPESYAGIEFEGKPLEVQTRRLRIPKSCAKSAELDDPYNNEQQGSRDTLLKALRKSLNSRVYGALHRVHTAQFTCDVCSKSFCLKADLERHHVVHTDVKMYQCRLCGSSFNRLDNSRVHLRRMHNQSAGSNEDILFGGKPLVDVGAAEVASKMCQCTLCGSSFSQLKNAKTHLRQLHKQLASTADTYILFGGKPLHVAKAAAKNAELERIEKERQGQMERCLAWGDALSDQLNEDAASGVQPEVFCQDCNRSFASVTLLNAHIKQCHYTATAVSHLAQKEKPRNVEEFLCSECGKKFPSHFELTFHSRLDHSTNKINPEILEKLRNFM